MSERILRWFGDRRNEKVLEMTHEHLELTTKAVNQLYKMVEKASIEPENKREYYEAISGHELEADQIRRAMIMELSKRELYPNERDDLMELVRAVDWIADWSQEAGRILMIIPFHKLPEVFRESIEEMCKENFACVRVLSQCIHELSGNPRKALELADQVEIFEGDLDDLYGEVRKHIATLEEINITRGAQILINEFINAIETIADWCENTTDIARAIAIRVI